MIKSFVEGNMDMLRYLYEMPAKYWLVMLGVVFAFALVQELCLFVPRYLRMRKLERKHESLRVIRQAIDDGLIKLPKED